MRAAVAADPEVLAQVRSMLRRGVIVGEEEATTTTTTTPTSVAAVDAARLCAELAADDSAHVRGAVIDAALPEELIAAGRQAR